MKPCVLYVSHTGNTQRLAEAISNLPEAPIFDITKSELSVADNYDLLVIGTPVFGLKSAPEATAFMKQLQSGEGKKLFFSARTLSRKVAHSKLYRKNKRGVKPKKADFADCLDEISKTVKR
ncbi:hypothetical protein G4O51_02085 [Candidatus Bathyarchaeota archaeon A05DMB-2]|jgi:flavodoxin|nr:hypothetical protein [Candidatus Bathyarchaeota archaeon A05DMB-2]